MIELSTQMIESRKLSESSANLYIKSLFVMNGKEMFKNLAFLRKKEEINSRIEPYAESTQKSCYTAAVTALSTVKDKKAYRPIYAYYYSKMMAGSAKAKAEDGLNEKTKKQTDVWMSWDQVKEKQNELKAEVEKFSDYKAITRAQYSHLFNYALLSLYVEIPPRRNADFLLMVVVPTHKDDMPKDRNYYDVGAHKMIFNVFKTAKHTGAQTLDVPTPLQIVLKAYLKYHPLSKTAGKKTYEFPLLVNADGEQLKAQNTITRLLGSIFGKRVGSSMLRHFYVSSKYGNVLTEMKADSEGMAHGLTTQRAYIKVDSESKE